MYQNYFEDTLTYDRIPEISLSENKYVAIEKDSYVPFLILIEKGFKDKMNNRKILLTNKSKYVLKGTYQIFPPLLKYFNSKLIQINSFTGYERYSFYGISTNHLSSNIEGYFEYPFSLSISKKFHENDRASYIFWLNQNLEETARTYAQGALVVLLGTFFNPITSSAYYENFYCYFLDQSSTNSFIGGDTTGSQFGLLLAGIYTHNGVVAQGYVNQVGDSDAKSYLSSYYNYLTSPHIMDDFLFIQIQCKNGQETTGSPGTINPSRLGKDCKLFFSRKGY